jgi:hypothetical protein
MTFSPEELEQIATAVLDQAQLRGLLGKADDALPEHVTGLPVKAAYGLKELSGYLSVSYDTLYDHYHSGILKGKQITNGKLGIGKIVIFRWSVLEFLSLPKEVKDEKQWSENLLGASK